MIKIKLFSCYENALLFTIYRTLKMKNNILDILYINNIVEEVDILTNSYTNN